MQSTYLEDWLCWIEQIHTQPIALGLDRVRAVATRLGLGRIARHCIVVAGTNGKGSTVTLIAAIARAAGWRVGAYTSPHLFRFNERIALQGKWVDDGALVAAFAQIEQARQGVPLTYFEFTTLAAFCLFQAADLDLAVLEVGLGGRLDAVNLIDGDVAVITTVAVDHTEWLGPDREAIGREKAGIMRGQKPVILGDEDPPTSVLRHAYQIGAPALRLGCDFFYQRLAAGRWRWRDVDGLFELPEPSLAGPIQLTNAAVAIAALRALPCSPTPAAWAKGLSQSVLPGRMAKASYQGVEVVLDVSHNPQAAAQFAIALAALPKCERTLAVFAALADKDSVNIAAALRDVVDQWHLAGLTGVRGQSAHALATTLARGGIVSTSQSPSVADAFASARRAAGPHDRICVFGSFHTVAQAYVHCD